MNLKQGTIIRWSIETQDGFIRKFSMRYNFRISGGALNLAMETLVEAFNAKNVSWEIEE